MGSILPSWIRIRNLNADPDPATQINADPCVSGSETLVCTNKDKKKKKNERVAIPHFSHPSSVAEASLHFLHCFFAQRCHYFWDTLDNSHPLNRLVIFTNFSKESCCIIYISVLLMFGPFCSNSACSRKNTNFWEKRKILEKCRILGKKCELFSLFGRKARYQWCTLTCKYLCKFSSVVEPEP
jgi:hypothetical protein